VAASYLHWSNGGYISLRDSEKEIKEVVDAVFGKAGGDSIVFEGFY